MENKSVRKFCFLKTCKRLSKNFKWTRFAVDVRQLRVTDLGYGFSDRLTNCCNWGPFLESPETFRASKPFPVLLYLKAESL